MRALFAILVTTATVGCGDNKLAPDAAPLPIDMPVFDMPPDADPLATLQGTGLCFDPACTQIDPSVTEYKPRFELYADGATKRRWFQLPPGTQIDTSDMDHWVFPVGTKFWKEFTRDGVRVETRFITKQLADDNSPLAWFYISYVWNLSSDSTTPVTGGLEDVLGTQHDIPSRSNCRECHEALQPSRVLGFQAIQLDGATGGVSLEDLIAQNLLTAPPTTGTPGVRFRIPGIVRERNALAYLHANCGHCHNPTSGTHDVTPIELRLETGKLASVATTPTVVTTVDRAAAVPFTENGTTYDQIIISGDPDNSGLIVRMNSMNLGRLMPKLGSEVVDPVGQTVLRLWITNL